MNDPKVGSVVPPPLGLIQLQQLLLMRYNDTTVQPVSLHIISFQYLIYYMYIPHIYSYSIDIVYMYTLCIYKCDYAYFISPHHSYITSPNIYIHVLLCYAVQCVLVPTRPSIEYSMTFSLIQ